MRYNRERSDTNGLIAGAFLLSMVLPGIYLVCALGEKSPALLLALVVLVVLSIVWRIVG